MDYDEFHNNDSDEEISEKHSHLLKFVEKLDRGQRIKRPERSEPSLQVSEFHLVNSGITDDDAVCVDDLVNTLSDRSHYRDINNKFRATKKVVAVLPKPLQKPVADKLKRAVGFENTTKELEKWNAIVTRNRIAPTQIFPFQRPSSPFKPNELVKRFRVQSELENELNALESKEPNGNGERVNEFALTLEEIVQKRLEAAKFRAQQSYKQVRAHRQKKIKSKKFHRMARNAKVKEQFNEFTKLQQVDPQSALKKLEQLNRARAEERMSLKHRNTSQWSKNKQIRAKYDKESRNALAQQLSINRELVQKVEKQVNSDDDDDDDVMENKVEALKVASTTSNPWVNIGKTPSEIDEFVSSYRKYWGKIHEADVKQKIGKTAENFVSANKKTALLTDARLTQPIVNIKDTHQNDNIDACKINEPRKKNRAIVSQSNQVKSCEDLLLYNEKMISESSLKNVNGIKTKAGTSEWSVEILDNSVQSMNNSFDRSLSIDNIFDTMDDDMKQKLRKKIRRVKHKLTGIPVEKSKSSINPDNFITDLSFNRMKLRPELDESLNENLIRTYGQHNLGFSIITENDRNDILLRAESLISAKSSVEIDPNAFINVKTQYKKNQVISEKTKKRDQLFKDSNEEKYEEEEKEEEEESGGRKEDDLIQQNIVTEAFADDNIVDEFRRERSDGTKKLELDNVDMKLPGWGAWGGNNLKYPVKRKRRFILKFPQSSLKNDENKGDFILIQDDSIVEKYQVNDLPHPFNSASDFEASIRAPIGRNFLPENAYKRLIEPTITTRMGQIIKPMDEDVLIENKNIKLKGKLARCSKKKM